MSIAFNTPRRATASHNGMKRRHFLAAGLATAAASVSPAFGRASSLGTRWKVRLSEGFDAICFLGPLAGGELYTRYYGSEIAAFRPRLPASVAADIGALWEEAAGPAGLFGPFLAVIFSSGHDATINALIAALERPEILRAPYAASRNWDASAWS